MHYQNEPKRDDCPDCGAKEGATMGSTDWGHSIPCCGDRCGLSIKAKIEKNTSSPEYKAAIEKLCEAKTNVSELRLRGIDVSHEPFQDCYL